MDRGHILECFAGDSNCSESKIMKTYIVVVVLIILQRLVALAEDMASFVIGPVTGTNTALVTLTFTAERVWEVQRNTDLSNSSGWSALERVDYTIRQIHPPDKVTWDLKLDGAQKFLRAVSYQAFAFDASDLPPPDSAFVKDGYLVETWGDSRFRVSKL